MFSLLAQGDYPTAMTTGALGRCLFVAAAMFVIGLIGFLTRRNLIIMFLCTELMFQGAGIALVAFGRYHLNHTGEAFVIFVITIAAAEAAMALALVVLLFRRHRPRRLRPVPPESHRRGVRHFRHHHRG